MEEKMSLGDAKSLLLLMPAVELESARCVRLSEILHLLDATGKSWQILMRL